MFDRTYPALMAEYNAWMTGQIYAACTGLSDTERKRDRGAFFQSIHATLEHVLWGDEAWLSRLSDHPAPTRGIAESAYPDFDDLRAVREKLDRKILGWANGVDEAWLAEPMTWTSRLYGFTQTQPRWVLVVQMFNHQTHHRGQVHALLTQIGIDPGPTDVPLTPVLVAVE
jgi:uncharacterized damage-inducible protein DinB